MSCTQFETRFMIVLLVFGGLVAPVWLCYGFVTAAALLIFHPAYHPASLCLAKQHPAKSPAGWHSLLCFLGDLALYWLDSFLHRYCCQSHSDPKRNRRHNCHATEIHLLDPGHWWRPRRPVLVLLLALVMCGCPLLTVPI